MGVTITQQKFKLLFYTFTVIILASDIVVGKEVLDLKTQQEYVRNNSIKTIQRSIETMQFANGDVYDCIDIYKQPTFLHPKLKDHKLQMRPTVIPNALTSSTSPYGDEVGGEFLDAEISSEHKCPEGSVPIQRLDLDATTRDKFAFGRSTAFSSEKIQEINENDLRFWATRRTRYKGPYYGGGTSINVYAVPDVGMNVTSAAMMWLKNNKVGVILRAGWHVMPSLFNDNQTRLFMEWSTDHEETSCYNDECLGFVVINPYPKLGMAITHLSTYLDYQQYHLRVYIYRDPKTGNWWLAVGSTREYVGYWAKAAVKNMKNAKRLEYGGYVYCLPNTRCPRMCNGVFPGVIRGGLDRACFFGELQHFDDAGNAFNFHGHEMDNDCVTNKLFADVSHFRYSSNSFTFGGPGF